MIEYDEAALDMLLEDRNLQARAPAVYNVFVNLIALIRALRGENLNLKNELLRLKAYHLNERSDPSEIDRLAQLGMDTLRKRGLL